MKRYTGQFSQDAPTELEIVDTFTKLIFGEANDYSGQELMIIEALRRTDSNVSLDSQKDMGVYLRALGVREMIGLVARVQASMARSVTLFPMHSAGAQSERRW